MSRTTPLLRSVLYGGIVALLVSAMAAAAPTAAWQSHVSVKLLDAYRSAVTDEGVAASTPGAAAALHPLLLGPRFDSQGRVQVDVHLDCSADAPVAQLKAAGLLISASFRMSSLCVVEGWLPAAAMRTLALAAGVQQIKVPAYSSHRAPKPGLEEQAQSWQPALRASTASPESASGSAIDGAAISIMRADQYVTQTGVNGSGVTVGVLSDNVSSLALIQSRGELPQVQVLTPSSGGTPSMTLGDEGTMMLEEIHAVAPGATLTFCAPSTAVEYVGCLGQLISAGATVIVDDLDYPAEDLMSSNGTFAQSVQQTLAANPAVVLFTAAGNFNGSYWEGTYSPKSLASLGQGSLTCLASGQVDYYVNSFNGGDGETLTVTTANTYPMTVQWADPFGQNTSNFDLYWANAATSGVGCLSATGFSDTFFGPYVGLSVGKYYVYAATPDSSLAGKFIKFWVGGEGATLFSAPTGGSIVSPQAFVPGVSTVGAVNGADGVGNHIETYSGRGPIKLLYPVATQIQAPSLVAPDAVYVDAAGTNFTLWPDGNFHGTSAAAPNVAAVATLLRGAFPTLSPSQLTQALQSGAAVLGSSAPDETFGYGRVDAVGALNQIPAPTISGGTSASTVGGTPFNTYSVTLNGVGKLRVSVKSSNPALIPASLVASGTPGVAISPSSCGSDTTQCTVSFTPALGQAGTSTVSVVVTDGANRTASTDYPLTVTNAATAVGTATGIPTKGGGGSIDIWLLAFLGCLVFLRLAYSQRVCILIPKFTS